MTESIIATYDNVKFIEGVTKMTQDNWQSYFSPVIQNGVYSGLEFLQQNGYSSNYYHVSDGAVFINGIKAELTTPEGYTDIGNCYGTGENDAFYCLRVYFDSQKAELIRKGNVYESITEASTTFAQIMWTLGKFIDDESYQCERTLTHYDIPLIYFGSPYSLVGYGRDLRRMVKIDNKREHNPRIPGIYNNAYGLIRSNNIYDTNVSTVYYLDTINFPDDAIIANSTSSQVTIKLYDCHYINDFNCSIPATSDPITVYSEAYSSLKGVARDTINFGSGATSRDLSGYKNYYYSIAIPAYSCLHLTHAYKDDISSYFPDIKIGKYYFVVEKGTKAI